MELRLPKILISNTHSCYRVDWDNQQSEGEKVLHEQHDYLTGCIDGYLYAIQKDAHIICLAANTGSIDNLTQDNALKFKSMLEELLYPVVKSRFKQLKNESMHYS